VVKKANVDAYINLILNYQANEEAAQ